MQGLTKTHSGPPPPRRGFTLERHPDAPTNPQPGDFALTRGQGFVSWLIRFGQGLRYWGKDRKYTYWNHAALFVDADGGIMEALGGGVVERNISAYSDKDYTVVRLQSVSPEDREHEVKFARWCLGQQYGYLTDVAIALSLVTGMKFGFGIDGQEICSGLVARALERTGEVFPAEPWHMMPADLAKFYSADPPAGKA